MGSKRANKPTEWLPVILSTIHLLVNVGILVCLIVIAQQMTELSDGVANVDPAKLEASVRNGVSSGIATGIPAVVVGLVNGTVPEMANMLLSVGRVQPRSLFFAFFLFASDTSWPSVHAPRCRPLTFCVWAVRTGLAEKPLVVC